jgi:hypothetical protein
MIFHRAASAERGFAPKGTGTRPAQRYELDPIRIALAIAFMVALIAAAIACHLTGWAEGANVFLHLIEITGGGIVGLIVGEQSASKE